MTIFVFIIFDQIHWRSFCKIGVQIPQKAVFTKEESQVLIRRIRRKALTAKYASNIKNKSVSYIILHTIHQTNSGQIRPLIAFLVRQLSVMGLLNSISKQARRISALVSKKEFQLLMIFEIKPDDSTLNQTFRCPNGSHLLGSTWKLF
jgi:hypothetical protein